MSDSPRYSPLVLFPDRTVLLPPAYCGSIPYYALMSAYPRVVIDYGMRFNKRQKDTHRLTILGTGGIHRLSMPIVSTPGMSSGPWGNVRLSSHGQWWHLHWGAIYSAYGRTPFFEFYRDEFEPLYNMPTESLKEFNNALDAVIRRILTLDTHIIDRDGTYPEDDYRSCPLPGFPAVPYYQMWSDRYGFTHGLSILDLIFNMGPEAPVILREMTTSHLIPSR